jgi:hypothetical protein
VRGAVLQGGGVGVSAEEENGEGQGLSVQRDTSGASTSNTLACSHLACTCFSRLAKRSRLAVCISTTPGV